MPEHWDGEEIDLDAVRLPDISVNRSRFSSARDCLWSANGAFDDWGVFSFQVRHIPDRIIFQAFDYTAKAVHNPLSKNYAHSEVRAFENGVHVDKARLAIVSPEAHLKFREQLLREVKIPIKPGEAVWDDD